MIDALYANAGAIAGIALILVLLFCIGITVYCAMQKPKQSSVVEYDQMTNYRNTGLR